MERRRPGPLPRAASAPTRWSATRLRRHGGDYSPRLPATSRGGRPRRVSASMRQLSPVARSSARTAGRHRLGPPQQGKPCRLRRQRPGRSRWGLFPRRRRQLRRVSLRGHTPDTAGGSSRCSAALAGRRASVGFPAGRPCVISTSRKRLAVLLSFSQAQPLSAETECYRR